MAEDLLVRLGDRIRTLRKRRGWTQAVMAERVGLIEVFWRTLSAGSETCQFWSCSILVRVSA